MPHSLVSPVLPCHRNEAQGRARRAKSAADFGTVSAAETEAFSAAENAPPALCEFA